jgi:hypothetical protein
MPAPVLFGSRLLDLWKGGFGDLRVRPKHNMPVLDVLRSCAILLVFTGHFAGYFKAARWFMATPAVNYGWTGVDLFFVLSGVLIGTQLWRELARTGDIRVGRFLLRRGLRIWPLYFSFVAFIAVEVVFFGRSSSGFWADAAYLSNYFHSQIEGGWSLSNEEQFYILAPLGISGLATILRVSVREPTPVLRTWTLRNPFNRRFSIRRARFCALGSNETTVLAREAKNRVSRPWKAPTSYTVMPPRSAPAQNLCSAVTLPEANMDGIQPRPPLRFMPFNSPLRTV